MSTKTAHPASGSSAHPGFPVWYTNTPPSGEKGNFDQFSRSADGQDGGSVVVVAPVEAERMLTSWSPASRSHVNTAIVDPSGDNANSTGKTIPPSANDRVHTSPPVVRSTAATTRRTPWM